MRLSLKNAHTQGKRITMMMLALALCILQSGSQLQMKANEKEDIINEQAATLYDRSYESLTQRISERGFAPTSLTGAYQGMFIRDSSIQIMAQTAYGDEGLSRSMLQYLLSYHQGFNAEYASHILPDLQDEYYGNHYLQQGDDDQPVVSKNYQEQKDFHIGLYLINGPDHAAGTAFVPSEDTIDTISAYLTKTTDADQVTVSIRTDIKDETSTIAKTEYTFGSSPNGWQDITFDKPVKVTPNQTYYLVLQATADSGNVIWYGTTTKQEHFKPGYNYDLPTFQGWIEQAQYPAFIIGKYTPEITSFTAQKDASTALYRINAPGNQAAQKFIPDEEYISEVSAYLSKSTDQDKVKVSIRKDYRDPDSTVGEMQYTFGEHANGWQQMIFDEPVKVEPGIPYYLVLQATEDSANVIWTGTTNVNETMQPAYNYDANVQGGWVEHGMYCTAFTITPLVDIQGEHAAAKKLITTGDTIESLQVAITSLQAAGTLEADIRKVYNDPTTSIGKARTAIDKVGSHDYTLTFDTPLKVEEGASYAVVLQAKDCSSRVNWNPTQGKGTAYLYEDHWSQNDMNLSLQVLPEWSGSNTIPLLKIGKDHYAQQDIHTDNEILTAVQVMLGKTTEANGLIKATLYKGDQVIAVCESDSAQLDENGTWLTFKFGLPLTGTPTEGTYSIRIEAPQAEKDSIIWYGTKNIDHYQTISTDAQGTAIVEGEASFQAARSTISPMSNAMQVDGNYMLIHAWAQFVKTASNTQQNKDFIKDSYPIIARFANYYLDHGFIDPELKLMRNANLEHSREGRYWNSYDAITNAFASQALYELSSIAQDFHDTTNAEKWLASSTTLTDGMNHAMTTVVDGKTIYAELYDVDHDMHLIQGFSWVNWGPMAAEWYGMDKEIMQNTYDLYKKYAVQDYDGYAMLDVCYDMDQQTYGNHIIGKGFAWELMYNDSIQDEKRMQELIDFVLAHSTKDGVYPETWQPGGHFSDIGNQEHCAWQVYAMSKVFPQLTKSYAQQHLQTLIEEASKLDEAIYTTDSMQACKDALDKAQALLADESSTRDACKQAYEDLHTAMQNLKENTAAIKTILKTVIEKAQAFIESEQFETLAPNVQAMIRVRWKEASDVYQNEGASREECFHAWKNLADALHYADFKADKTMLKALMEECEAIDTSKYTEASVKAFQDALTNANKVYENQNALQERINAAYDALQAAKDGLREIPVVTVDKSILSHFIEVAKDAMNEQDHYLKNADWDAFVEAFANAQKVYIDETATQEAINIAATELSNAYLNIRYAPSEDMLKQLEDFLNYTKKINRALYSAKDLKVIDDAVDKAQALFDQKDFDKKEFDSFTATMGKVMDIIDHHKITKPADKNQNKNDGTQNGVTAPGTSDTTKAAGSFFIFLFTGTIVLLSIKRSQKKKQ